MATPREDLQAALKRIRSDIERLERREQAPSILVVDDDRIVRDALAAVFRRRGYSVQTAEDGLQALASIRRASPDLVLLDVRMPRLDGLGVLAMLRRDGIAPLVVMLTAISDVESARKAVELGACDYLLKPFDVDYLERTVETLLAGPRGPEGA